MSNESAKGNLKGFYILLAAVAVLGIGAVGYSVGSKALGTPAMEPVDLSAVGGDMRLLRDMAVPVTKGEADAPVTIIVFEDYLCSHCASFSLRERPLIDSELVDTGKARLVYYDFVLDPRAEAGTFLAARAARCAGDQGHFWDFQDRLFRSQIRWAQTADKAGAFQDYAEDLGVDGGEFKSCLNSDRHAEAVSANRELAQALGLGGTPSVLVGVEGGMSRRLADYSFGSIQAAVEELTGEGGGI
jgi:protein-disulfide isomerase